MIDDAPHLRSLDQIDTACVEGQLKRRWQGCGERLLAVVQW